MMKKVIRICVIGAGPSGLAACKVFSEYKNNDVVVFESQDTIGGLWTGSYDSLTTNTSRAMMMLSDFPWPKELLRGQDLTSFADKAAILAYYRAYATHNNLHPRIRTCATVKQVQPAKDGGWIVTVSEGHTGSAAMHYVTSEYYFDKVVVASGRFGVPRVPAVFAAIHIFTGTVMHSSAYRDALRFHGRDVALIGLGNSALDIALELSSVAASVTIVTRSGAVMMPVCTRDTLTPLDQVFESRAFISMPKKWKGKVTSALITSLQTAFQRAGMPVPARGAGKVAVVKQPIEFMKALAAKRIRIVAGTTTKLLSNGLCVENDVGKEEELRATDVILCCGYKLTFPYLEKDVLGSVFCADKEQLYLYKQIIHPLHPSLAFVGQIETTGNYCVVAEMQARWTAARWSSSQSLDRDQMTMWARDYKAEQEGSRSKVSNHIAYIPYLDSLAQDMGVMPDLSEMPLSFTMLRGPVVGAQYRLRGFGANPENAGQIIRDASIRARL